jgi:hypothetical protein
LAISGAQGLHEGGRHGIVDAAGEQHLQLGRCDLALGEFLKQLVDHRAPEHEAAQGADVSAALAAFEDEAARAFPDEHRDQVGRGHVQESGNAGLLERDSLVGATPAMMA